MVVGVEEEVVVVVAEAAGAGHRKTSRYNSSTVRVAGEEEEAAVVAPAPFLMAMAKPEAWPPLRPSSPEEWVEPAVAKASMSAGSEKGSSSHREKKTAKDGSLEKSGRSRRR